LGIIDCCIDKKCYIIYAEIGVFLKLEGAKSKNGSKIKIW